MTFPKKKNQPRPARAPLLPFSPKHEMLWLGVLAEQASHDGPPTLRCWLGVVLAFLALVI